MAKVRPGIGYAFHKLQSAVMTLSGRVNYHDKMELTHDEVQALFVPREARAALKEAAKYSECRTHMTSYLSWRDIPFTLSQGGSDIPLEPRGGFALANDADPGLVAKVEAWLARRMATGLEFGRVNWLIGQLNGLCRSPAQVRYYWPAILTLGSVAELSSETMDAYREPVGTNAPPLPLKVRAACTVAAGTITAASLLDKVKHGPPTDGAVLDIVGGAWKAPRLADPVTGEVITVL